MEIYFTADKYENPRQRVLGHNSGTKTILAPISMAPICIQMQKSLTNVLNIHELHYLHHSFKWLVI